MQRPCEAGSILRSNQSDKHTVGTRDVTEAKMLVKATRDIIIRINNKCAGPDLAAYCKSSLDCREMEPAASFSCSNIHPSP